MKCTVYPFGTLTDYRFAVAVCRVDGRWLMCRKQGRDTWELPGGHIEPGESPETAARRELYEETGITDATLYPLCDYWTAYEPHEEYPMAQANTAAFFAVAASAAAPPPAFEMAETRLFEPLPQALTYPDCDAALRPWMYALATLLESGARQGHASCNEGEKQLQ